MIRALADTNVLAPGVLGFANPQSTAGEVLRAWRAATFELLASEHILAELMSTLRRPYFQRRITDEQLAGVTRLFRTYATIVDPDVTIQRIATHPEDDLILAAAVSGAADYLITGDRQLQRLARVATVDIVSPRAFLDLLERGLT